MTWTAPEFEPIPTPRVGDERIQLVGLLQTSRRCLLHKCSGLTAEQLATRAVPPSDLSLLGLIRHCADVERHWFRRRFLGEWATLPLLYEDGAGGKQSFTAVDPARAADDHATLVAEWAAVDEALAGRGPDDGYHDRNLGEVSLRWVYHHVVTEYQRHCGHADLLRERIDGVVGL
ncbi:DinB family protein [Microlunatus soli]|uniref:DinB superfamily protein n=1 Tax=Microlunatus soli TaxID=630515 RepID=A0A1H1TI03_9ACTN|nr:DinB family protein [Microlunatus soli]SDS59824.1 Protein of unknown function [Microlunatus soli]